MEIIELKSITRKDSLIHYINKYDCVIVFKVDDSVFEQGIEVILEKTALGTTDIQILHTNEALKKYENNLKDFISELNKKDGFV